MPQPDSEAAAWALAPASRSIAARLDGALPRPVARLRTDGATAFVIRTKREHWHPDFAATFDWLAHMTPEEKKRHGRNVLAGLPLPPVPGRAPSLPAEWAQSGAELDPRMLGWGDEARDNPSSPRVVVEAWGGGGEHPCIHLHAPDRAFITIYKRTDTEGETWWECRVEAKARALYADGLNLWMVRWLGALGWILCGKYCTPTETHTTGWKTSQWHLNSDFESLHMVTEDAWKVCGWRSGRAYGDGAKVEERREAGNLAAFQKANPYFASTIYLGRLTSDACMVVYRKSEQLEAEKKLDPACSMYSPEWRSNGWDGRTDITRVELRLRKKGLVYTDPRTGDVVHDFRDPAKLLDREAARHVWQYVTTKRRLTAPEAPPEVTWNRDAQTWEKRGTRLTRAPLDPAWLRVIRLGYNAPNRDIRQIPRDVRAMTRRERMAKSQKAAMLAAVAFAAQHGAELVDWHDAGAVLEAMGRHMSEHGAPEELDALPRAVVVKRSARYAVQQAAFFRGEADAHFEDFERAVGCPLEKVDWSKVDATGPPRELDANRQREEKEHVRNQ